MKKQIVKPVLKYNVIFDPCEEGGFTVTVPKLPGVITEGDTFEKAFANVQDAIEGYLQILHEAGENIPEPDEKTFTAMVDVRSPFGAFAGV